MQGAWIEMDVFFLLRLTIAGSLPVQGAWIEIALPGRVSPTSASLPVQGAWIEMPNVLAGRNCNYCRSPCRERGLKSEDAPKEAVTTEGRSPCRERGLKLRGDARCLIWNRRSPCRERGLKCSTGRRPDKRLSRSPCRERGLKSCSFLLSAFVPSVAPRAGSVD